MNKTNKLDDVFKNYSLIYNKILSSFYPSLGSTGFQERNLAVNFSKAFEKTFEGQNLISWFELQFGKKKNCHFDSLIITEDSLYFVEAKRFSSVKLKTDSIKEDIFRIQSFIKEDFKKDERFADYQKYHIYGVILADVWNENKAKKEIRQKFVDKQMFADLKVKNQFYNVIDLLTKSSKTTYSLLSFVWEF